MITCDFHGRLGNNLFQMATVISLAKQINEDFIFPHEALAGHRGKITVDLGLFKYKFQRGHYIADNEHHESKFEYEKIEAKKSLKIAGFFQSHCYFDNVREDLLEIYFTPSEEIKNKLTQYLISDYSLGISVRRGDYLMLQGNHCVLSSEYYQNTIDKHFSEGIDQIYIFSDDLDWCRDIFGDQVIYVNDSIGVQLFLMSKMKNLILSNSTFAWWGAYLNQTAEKIIIPDPWFGPNNHDKDTIGLYYPNWIIEKHTIQNQNYTLTQNMFN